MRAVLRVVIIGAGFAGLAAARGLASAGAQVEVTLVDRRNHHLFQALLYQVASAGLNAGEIASPVRSLFRGQSNIRVLMADFCGFDDAEVTLDEGRRKLPYDALILAIGVRTSYFGNDAWARWAPGMKTLTEALALRRRVLLGFEEAEKELDAERRRFFTTIIIVGGGPTGVELAGAFAELRRNVLANEFANIRPAEARVVLIEAGDRVLAPFPPDLSEAARRDLEDLGVEVRLGERVLEVKEGYLRTTQGEIAAHTIVWAAGVEGHQMVRALGHPCDRGGRLLVDADLRLQGSRNVYCIGDMACCTQDGKPLPGLAPVAMQQGSQAARNVLLQLENRASEPFIYIDPGIMATVGRSRGIAVLGKRHLTGLAGWSCWLYHHLLRIVDFENRVMVVMRWAWAYAAWRWGVRLIVEPEEPLERRRDENEGPPEKATPTEIL